MNYFAHLRLELELSAIRWIYSTCPSYSLSPFDTVWHSLIINSVTFSLLLLHWPIRLWGSIGWLVHGSPSLATARSSSNAARLLDIRQLRSTACQQRGLPQSKNEDGSKSYYNLFIIFRFFRNTTRISKSYLYTGRLSEIIIISHLSWTELMLADKSS